MTREELVNLITSLQNLRHMLMTAGNVGSNIINVLDSQIQDTQRKLDALNPIKTNEPEEMN